MTNLRQTSTHHRLIIKTSTYVLNKFSLSFLRQDDNNWEFTIKMIIIYLSLARVTNLKHTSAYQELVTKTSAYG